MDVFRPKQLAWASAVVPLAAFCTALSMIMFPTVPDWAAPPVEAAPQLPPFYLPLDVPLRAGPDGGTSMVELSLTFVARLAPMDLLTVSEQVKKRRDFILADLTEILLQETLVDTDPARLHSVLPALLREATNRGLNIETLPDPVVEVLITEMRVQ